MTDNTNIIIVAVATTVGFSEIVSASNGNGFVFKPILGGFLLGAFLFIISTINAPLGEAFAILVIIATLIFNGSPVLAKVSSLTK